MKPRLANLAYATFLAFAPGCAEPQPIDPMMMSTRELQANAYRLLGKQPSRDLYFALNNEIVLAEYARAGLEAEQDQIVLYVIKTPRKVSMPMIDSSLAPEFEGNPDVYLLIHTCGEDYGDDSCDQFSRQFDTVKFGDRRSKSRITSAEKAIVRGYLEDINRLLK